MADTMEKRPGFKQFAEMLYRGGKDAFFREAEASLRSGGKKFVITDNPETFTLGRENEEFGRLLLAESTTVIPDGIGVVKAANLFGIPLKERITGVDFVTALLEAADRLHKSVFFYGAKPEVLEALLRRIGEEYPGVTVAGSRNGYGTDDDQVFAEIAELRPDIVLVALGIPRQELLIGRHLQRFDKGIFVGVGGSFDVLSGTKKRAPAFFVKCNLEWLYRIIREPSRLGRFYRGNVRFMFQVKKEARQTAK